jgi:hypothetical protein
LELEDLGTATFPIVVGRLAPGDLELGGSGKNVTLTNIPHAATATPTGSICIDSNNHIYVKLTAGSCI